LNVEPLNKTSPRPSRILLFIFGPGVDYHPQLATQRVNGCLDHYTSADYFTEIDVPENILLLVIDSVELHTKIPGS
jgi:hypothetical protein